jgi:methyl-accepting chemotaxis protein
MSENRRKQLLISRKFQLTLIARVAVVNIIAGCVFGSVMYFALNEILNTGNLSAGSHIKKFSDMLLPVIIFVSLSGMIFTVIASAYIVLAASHKISGPLYRLNITLKHIADGDLSQPMGIRENDETKESHEALDSLRKTLWNDLSIMREKIEIIKHKTGKNSSSEVKKALSDLEKTAGRYKF